MVPCWVENYKTRRMNEALQNFSKNTRHTTRELDRNPGLIARKYLAVHFGNGYETYAHVADDYEWVNRRTHNPPLEMYQKGLLPDENAFVELMKKGWSNIGDIAKLNEFCESVFPHQDTWRSRAAFLIAHRLEHPSARTLLNAVMREDLPDERVQSASQRDAEYEAWMKINTYGQMATAEEMGAILNGLDQLDDVIVEPIKSKPTEENESVKTEEYPIVAAPAIQIVESKPTKTYEEWASHPDIVEWRRESLLSPALDASVLCGKYMQTNSDLAREMRIDYATVEEATKLIQDETVKKLLDPEKVYTASDILKLWKQK